VMREPLDPFAKPAGIKLFNCIHDARMNVAPPFAEHPVIGDLMRECMFKGVFEIGKQTRFVEELGCLEVRKAGPEILLRQLCNRQQQHERYVLADYRRGLQKPLVLR
jgi:hypothetical protein